MVTRDPKRIDRAGRLARLEAENARLRRLTAELAADATELQGDRRRDGAVDPAHRLLVGTLPQD